MKSIHFGEKRHFKDRKKDWRKKWHGAKSFDNSCQNHGSCEYCKNNRTIFSRKNFISLRKEIDEYFN